MAKLSEILRQIEEAEDVGNLEQADALRKRVEDAGYGHRLPERSADKIDVATEEPSFLDKYGRIIAEGGGSLVGGAIGLPGGIPGIMAGAALGNQAGGMGWDYLTGSPAPSPQEQVTSALYGSMGGPDPARRVAPKLLQGMVPEGNLFDIGRATAVSTADDLAEQASKEADRRVGEAVAERGGYLTPANYGNKLSARAEAIAESSPFSVDIMTEHAERNINALDQYIDDYFPTSASRNVAGQRIGIGLEEAEAGQRILIGNLYDRVDEIVKSAGRSLDDTISMPQLKELAAEYDDLVARTGEFGKLVFQDPDLQRSIKAIKAAIADNTEVPYSVIKDYRTILGRKIGNAFGNTGEAVGQKRLYGVLSEDLAEGVEELGGISAREARQKADEANEAFNRSREALKPLFNNLDSPEKMYEALAGAMVSNVDLVQKAKTALPKADWDRFVDTYVRRMSLARPGAQDVTGELVSPRTLVTNLAKLRRDSPEGYRLLIQGKEDAFQTIERMAQGLTDSQQYLNRSQTAGALQGQQFIQELGTAGVGATGALLFGQGPAVAAVSALALAMTRPMVARMYAKALTSPNFAAALSQVGKTRDVLPTGMEMARALIAAGADEQEVMEVFNESQ